MITYTVTREAVAVILDSSERLPLRNIIENCLISNGLEPWADIEIEEFSLCNERLLIARPRAPMTARIWTGAPRLQRLG